MKHNLRPFSVTFVGGASALLGALYLYRGIGAAAFILGFCFCYFILGILVGTKWPVYAWQISLVASSPSWIFAAWRLISSKDQFNINLDFSLFLWLPFIALISAYAGTYGARRMAITRKKQAVSGK